jgi:transcriptional regulator with XRE-family HTH domain
MADEQRRAAFVRALKAAREQRGVSQRELARLVDVHPSTVAQWEIGQSVPRVPAAVRVERALDVEEGQLLRLLGYLHPDVQARTVAGVVEAVESDPSLAPEDRELLLTIYRQLARRGNAQQASK